MTAVLETPPQNTSDAKEWTMPPILEGDDVLWYAHGDRTREGHKAVVESVYAQTITCRLVVLGVLKECVRHLTDPSIRRFKGRNVADENFGTWDYLPARGAESAWKREVTSRIESLESAADQVADDVRAALIGEIDELKERMATIERAMTSIMSRAASEIHAASTETLRNLADASAKFTEVQPKKSNK